jgi:hypothetical protein
VQLHPLAVKRLIVPKQRTKVLIDRATIDTKVSLTPKNGQGLLLINRHLL